MAEPIDIRAAPDASDTPAMPRRATTRSEALLDAGDPMAIVGRQGRILLANEPYRALIASLTAAGDDAARALAARPPADLIAEVQALGRAAVHELTARLETGMRHLRFTYRPLHHQGLESGSVACQVSDITPLNAVRRAADLAQERCDDLARLVSDWVWECDAAFRFQYTSHRVLDVLGEHPMMLYKRSLFEIGHFLDDDKEPIDDATRTPFRDRIFEIVRADGARRLFRMSGLPIYDAAGAFRGFRGTAKDITGETESRHSALDARRRLSDAVESVSEAIALHGRDKRLVLCNSPMRELYERIGDVLTPGRPYQEILRATIAAGYVALGDRPAEDYVAEELARFGSRDEPYEVAIGEHWMRVDERPTSDGGTVVVYTDISGLKAREVALMEAKDDAEMANRTKTEFLANMSHELRTPLNAIIGFSEIIKEELFGPVGNANYTQYIGDILDSAHHLLNIINDILDVSKAEAGKLELAEEPLDLHKVLASTMRLVRGRADEAGVRLETRLADNLPRLYGDDRKLKQVLLNLISNAV